MFIKRELASVSKKEKGSYIPDLERSKTMRQKSVIWIEDRGIQVIDEMIIATPCIGIDYAGEDAELLWRFNLSPSFSTWCLFIYLLPFNF